MSQGVTNSTSPTPQLHASRLAIHNSKQAAKQNPSSTAAVEKTNDSNKSQNNNLNHVVKGAENKKPEKDKGSQMVTIRRVMDPSSAEPTVTITLKGDQPETDKVLFKLVNGQGKLHLVYH